ncbi:MAG: prepilin-type N-terminal cleavage/methylation domain-containing protein [Desulfobacterales bacterium]|nr:prepilin-type N-terminal cleavage/methylation domain-containing protein [Desulfobacterales bacterium]
MRENRGFTLIELLVVIAIIGIITAIAVPNYMTYLARVRLKAACREMSTMLQFARTQALGSDEAWRVAFDPAAECYYLLDGSTNVFQVIDLAQHPGISFGSNNPAPIDANHVGPPADGITYVGEKVKFNPEGTATAGTVYLRNSRGDTMALGTTSATGRIKIWYDFGTGWQI